MHDLANKCVLVTGANSGLGFEAAAQLAEAGFGRVILVCRSQKKADGARSLLVERVGANPFATLVVDLADVAASQAAAEELVRRGSSIDALLLNAGVASGDALQKTRDGLEMSFASSLIGHHVITVRLLEAGLLASGARVVIAGSEAARGDLPAIMGMKLHGFAIDPDGPSGPALQDAMGDFARGGPPGAFNGTHAYATTKLFVAWWAAAMSRIYRDRASFFTVSPGANLGTNAARKRPPMPIFATRRARTQPGISSPSSAGRHPTPPKQTQPEPSI